MTSRLSFIQAAPPAPRPLIALNWRYPPVSLLLSIHDMIHPRNEDKGHKGTIQDSGVDKGPIQRSRIVGRSARQRRHSGETMCLAKRAPWLVLLCVGLICQLAVSQHFASRATRAALILLASTSPPAVLLAVADSNDVVEEGNGGNSNEGVAESEGSFDTAGNPETCEDAEDEQPAEPRYNASGDRVITASELARHVGEGGASETNQIWLSILGKVYDVSTGEDFYGHGKGGYAYYAGRDASPCFSTGKNNDEGAAEALEEWEDKKLMGVWEWSTFYEDHETYKYVGVLAGSKYFDDEGNELPVRQDIVKRASEAKAIADKEREEKKKKRQAERLARKNKIQT